jgi:hypothetical protein
VEVLRVLLALVLRLDMQKAYFFFTAGLVAVERTTYCVANGGAVRFAVLSAAIKMLPVLWGT